MTDIVERLREIATGGGYDATGAAAEAAAEIERLRGIVRDAEPLLWDLREFTRKIGDFEARDAAQDVLDRIRGKDDD